MYYIFLGIGSLAFGGWMTFDYGRKLVRRIRLVRTGGRTTAMVADVLRGYEPLIGYNYYPKLKYTAEGKRRTTDYNLGSSWPFRAYKKGQIVKIAYNLDDLKDIVVVPEWRKIFGHVFVSLFWLAIAVAGMLILVDVIFLVF